MIPFRTSVGPLSVTWHQQRQVQAHVSFCARNEWLNNECHRRWEIPTSSLGFGTLSAHHRFPLTTPVHNATATAAAARTCAHLIDPSSIRCLPRRKTSLLRSDISSNMLHHIYMHIIVIKCLLRLSISATILCSSVVWVMFRPGHRYKRRETMELKGKNKL
jgi:hypothetical protein